MRENLAGMIFNYWEVLSLADHGTNQNTYYMCRCMKCGVIKRIQGQSIKSGRSRMCRSCSAKESQHHKYTGDRIRRIFSGMWQRCYDKNSSHYKYYGGRGIKICAEWLNNRELFYDWAYANGYADDLSIERIDVNGDYCPENCTFIPLSDQTKNRRNTHRITICGETKCLSDWCKVFNADRHSVKRLHDSGVSWEDALRRKAGTSHSYK